MRITGWLEYFAHFRRAEARQEHQEQLEAEEGSLSAAFRGSETQASEKTNKGGAPPPAARSAKREARDDSSPKREFR
jgi:hypothetical protein